MTNLALRTMRISPLALVLLVLVSGCRMYGGHGSEEAAFAEIQIALERYEARAERMVGDQQALTDAAMNDASLTPLMARMAALVDAQDQALAHHREAAASVDQGSGYRTLHRALGSMVSEQQIVEDAYARLVADILGQDQFDRKDPARYVHVPAKLARLEASLAQVSIREAVR